MKGEFSEEKTVSDTPRNLTCGVKKSESCPKIVSHWTQPENGEFFEE